VNEQPSEGGLFTFGGHLEILRKMLFRIIAVVIVLAAIIFCFKKETFTPCWLRSTLISALLG